MLLEDHHELQHHEPNNNNNNNHNHNNNNNNIILTDKAIKIAGTVQKSEYQVPQKMQMEVRTMDRVK